MEKKVSEMSEQERSEYIAKLVKHCEDMAGDFYEQTYEKGIDLTAANAMLINILCQSFAKVRGVPVFLDMLLSIMADMGINAIAGKSEDAVAELMKAEKGGTIH